MVDPQGRARGRRGPAACALREFEEETGSAPPADALIDLGEVRQKNGKRVTAWAAEGDLDADAVRSNTFTMQWPPRSGRMQEFPEIDRAGWFGADEAREKLHPRAGRVRGPAARAPGNGAGRHGVIRACDAFSVSSRLALLLLPAVAAAEDPGAPARVLWNSTPDGVRAGGSWDARLSVLRGPGGADPDRLRPVLIVTEMASDTTRSIPTFLDVPPNTFKALVRFPRQGDYTVTVASFDPRRPDATANLGRPVSVAAAAAPAVGARRERASMVAVGAGRGSQPSQQPPVPGTCVIVRVLPSTTKSPQCGASPERTSVTPLTPEAATSSARRTTVRSK